MKLYKNFIQNKHKTIQKHRTTDTRTPQKVSISPANTNLYWEKHLNVLVLSS